MMNLDDANSEYIETMADAFERAGIQMPEPRDETPQEAAERIWEGTKRTVPHSKKPASDPVETRRQFAEWAEAKPGRILAILTRPVWHRIIRGYLERDVQKPSGWRHGAAFKRSMHNLDKQREATATADYERRHPKRERWDHRQEVHAADLRNKGKRERRADKKLGLKKVYAKVDIATGAVLSIIDREYGPFAHIRINGLHLPEATTEEALCYCDNQTADVRFVRALCSLIPDPRKPIGEQWTAEIIREAREAASRTNAE